MKTVIYKENGCIMTTTEENYNNNISDCFKVHKWVGFDNYYEVIQYCTRYCNKNESDFICIY